MNNHSSRSAYIFSAAWAFALVLSAVPTRAQSQSGGDRIPVTLSDPSRPARVKASLINGGITVKAYDGKEVIVEARTRGHERAGQPVHLREPVELLRGRHPPIGGDLQRCIGSSAA